MRYPAAVPVFRDFINARERLMSTKPIRVLAVDDHSLLRDGIAKLLAAQPDMELVGEASNGREAIECFRKHRPDVALMDLRMPDMNGIEAIRAIRTEFPSARIVVLTTYAGDVQALGALKAGASGYLLKSMVRKDLLDTIRTVHAGKRRIPPEIATEIAEHAADDALTEREIDVLRKVGSGNSNKQIAAQLAISEGTVKARLARGRAELKERFHLVTSSFKGEHASSGSTAFAKRLIPGAVGKVQVPSHTCHSWQRFKEDAAGLVCNDLFHRTHKRNTPIDFWEVAVEAHRFRCDFLLPSRAGTDPADPAGTSPPSCT